MEIIVTRLSNIETDREGNFLLDEEGIPVLKDEEDVGLLSKTHVVQLTQMVDSQIKIGHAPLSEVFWNKHRTPAPALMSPNELVWLSAKEDDEDDGGGEELHDEEHVQDDFDVEALHA